MIVAQQDTLIQGDDENMIDKNTMRGYKSAMSSQIRQLGVCLEDENRERMKKIAEDIVWRLNVIMNN